MGRRLLTVDRETPFLLPPDLKDWIPENHIIHFIIDAVNGLPECYFQYNWRGTGSEQYSPQMMLTLLIYCYVTGRFASRVIESSTYCDVVVRYICGGSLHPDHDTIAEFRRNNRELFESAFLEVLQLANEMGNLKQVGTVSVDGSKIKANASKHKAVSFERSGKQLEILREEVKQLMKKAEKADSSPLDDGLSVPSEIARRETRIEKLEEARRIIKQRYEEECLAKEEAYKEKAAKRLKSEESGKKTAGRKTKPPADLPPENKQYNFSDPESRIMKAGNGNHYEQAYNVQLAVDTESMLIVGRRVTNEANDKEQLKPVVESIPSEQYKACAVLADSGYYSEKAVTQVESDSGPLVYVSLGKAGHHVRLEDLEKQEDPLPPAGNSSVKVKMSHRMKTKAGKALYKLRKQTVEPVFGIIKQAMGFRRFSVRGKINVKNEWNLVCLAYNLKRLFNLQNPELNGKSIWAMA